MNVRLVVGAAALAALIAGCSKKEAPPAQSADWAVPYGHEFWRKPSPLGEHEVDLTQVMERVSSAFAKQPDGALRAEGRGYLAVHDGGALRFTPAGPDAAAFTLELAGLRHGGTTLPIEAGGAVVTGNVVQRRVGADVVEHLEARSDVAELTWVLARAPKGEGDLAVDLAASGLMFTAKTAGALHFADGKGVARVRVADAEAVDASGRRWPLALAYEEGRVRIAVPRSILETAAYPLAIDPTIGAEFGIDNPSAGMVQATMASIACGGGTCLVVWPDANGQGVRAARFDGATGTGPDGGGVIVSDSPGAGQADVVFDGTDFIVVYGGPTLRARRVTTSFTVPSASVQLWANQSAFVSASYGGGVLGIAFTDFVTNQFSFATWDGTTTAVATLVSGNRQFVDVGYDGTNFITAWAEYVNATTTSDVFAARVSPAASVLTAPFAVAATNAYEDAPTVAGNGAGSILIWSTGSGARAQRYDASFSTVGGQFPVLSSGGQQGSVTFDGANYEFVSYQKRQRINATTGALLDGGGGINNTTLMNQPIVAFDGTRYVTAFLWNSGASNPMQLRALRFNAATNAQIDAGPAAVATSNNNERTPRLSFNGTNYLLAWIDQRSTGRQVTAALVDETGAVLTPAGISIPGSQPNDGTVRVSAGGGKFVVAWLESGTGKLAASRVLGNGTVEDAAPRYLTNSNTQDGNVAFDGTRWVFVFTTFATQSNASALTLTPGGTQGTAFALATANNNEQQTRIACNNSGTCLAMWSLFSSGNTLQLARVTAGALQDATPTSLSSLYGVEVASDGTNFLIAQGGTGYSARVVNADLSMPGADVPLNTAPRDLSFDGRNYVALYANGTSLTAEQLSPSGTKNAVLTLVPSLTMTNYDAHLARGTTARKSLLTYTGYDSTLQASRTVARFVEFSVAPVASDVTASTQEDTQVSIPLSGTDGDNDPLTFTVVTPPSNGTVTITGSTATYTPAANFNGADAFTYQADDGDQTSNTATVDVTVDAVNDAPVATAQTVSFNEDTTVAITLAGTDVDGDALTFAIATPPAHGTLTGTLPNLTYQPAPNYNGTDAFTFTANDGTDDSAPATVTLDIAPVNDLPLAANGSATVAEDAPGSITLSGTDVDGDALTYVVVTAPSHGTLSGTPPNLTYSPAANYFGPDSFLFKVNDGTADSNDATVSISVTAVNDAPTALAQSVTTAEDTPKSITPQGTDPDGDALTVVSVTQPAHGSVTFTSTGITYTPAANYNGPDTFTFKLSDGALESADATIDVTVTPANDAPVADAQSVNATEDAPQTITLTATDPDGDAVTFALVQPPSNGTATLSGAVVTYTPAANYHGPDAFTFRANDGALDSNVAQVSITVAPVNDAPVADALSATTAEDTAATVQLSGNDVDGDPLTYALVAPPAHGTATLNGSQVTYTPAADYNGPDAFTFKANDGTADSAPATVTLTVTPVNDAPAATSQNASTAEDAPLTLQLTGTDPEGDALTFALALQPSHGTVTGTPPNVTYTPNADYNGLDAFSFTVNDGAATSNLGTVSLTVTPVNDAPVANAKSVSTIEDTPVPFVLDGTDVDGDALTYAIVSPPSHGTLSGTAPNLTYTPAANYAGPDAFTFKVSDGALDSAPATVSLTVSPANDPPVALPQTVSTAEDAAASLTLAGTDTDGDPLTFAVVAQPSHGTLSGTAPNLTYTPAADYNGPDSFTFKANDGTQDSAAATVSVTLTPVNDAPAATAQTVSVLQGQSAAITLSGTDVDGDALTFTIVQPPADGTLSGTPPNLTYDAPAGFRGQTSFTFTANDGTVDSAPAAITLNVNNGAPVVTASAELLKPFEGQPVKFTATAADPGGDTLTFEWDFGDGATSTDQNPEHTFADQGLRTVTVTVSDGVDTASASVDVDVQNGAPLVVPSDATATGDEAQELQFTVQATDPGVNDTLTVVWHWDDGSPDSTGATAAHTFADNGTYHVTVTATDSDGAATVGTREVTISNTPPVPEQQATLQVLLGDTATATLKATDRAGDRDPLTWSLVEGKGALSEDGTFTWTADEEGTFTVKARVADDDDGVAESVFTVEVTAPEFTGGGCGCTSGATSALTPFLSAALALWAARRRRR